MNHYSRKVVVVLQDASSEVSWDAIRFMIDDFSLSQGDELILLAVLHQVTNPFGFKCKIGGNSMFDVSLKYVEEEIARKKEELSQHAFIQIMEQCPQIDRVNVNVEVVAGPCPKMAAYEATNSLKPTWVLLDRKFKKESKFFMEKMVSCGISKVTRHNTVQQLRTGPDQIWGPCVEDSTCSVCNNRRPNKMDRRRIDFSYAQLYAATSGFSHEKYLSKGGFGSVYRGKLKNGIKIAVKKLSEDSFQGEKEFKMEVKVLSNACHKNVVMLLGSCSEGSHRLLVYEYICNGSLEQHLSRDEGNTINWDERIKIASGAAKGLEYLHSKDIIHRDVRPSNILITHDHQSLLGDFGMARTQQTGDSDHNVNNNKGVLGTFGYLAPEYAVNGRASTKMDVYSYGVVLLQLITGFCSNNNNKHGGGGGGGGRGGESLLDWARPLLKSREYPALIDKRILDSHDVHQLFWMVWVAEKCLEVEPRKRWTMPTVVSALNYIVEGGNANFIQDFFSPEHSDTVDSILSYPGEESDDDDHHLHSVDNPNMKKMMINNCNNSGSGSLMMLMDDYEFVCPAKSNLPTTTTDSSKRGNKIKGATQTSGRSGEFLCYDEMVV